jgi:hypothetical protein
MGEGTNPKKICQELLENNNIQSIENKTFFDEDGKYKFYCDRDDIAENMIRQWKGPVREAIVVS